MIRDVLQSGNPILRKKSRPVTKVDKKVKDLIKDLKDTLAIQKDPQGVGLAAPQIGKNLQVFIASYKKFRRVVVNPVIIKISKQKGISNDKKKEILEGCLSLPNYYGPLKREKSVTLKYLDENGKEITETFKNFGAQIILHEIDHLKGILFIDKILKEKKPLYRLEDKKWEEVELI